MSVSMDEVNRLATPLCRKYDWHTAEIDNGVRLTVTDGQKNASVDITKGEDVQDEIKRLIEQVDNHNYTVLS